jgi:hypothetical protein
MAQSGNPDPGQGENGRIFIFIKNVFIWNLYLFLSDIIKSKLRLARKKKRPVQ